MQNHSTEEHSDNQKLILQSNSEIEFKNLSFQYEGPKSPYVLKDITFTIPEGKNNRNCRSKRKWKNNLNEIIIKVL